MGFSVVVQSALVNAKAYVVVIPKRRVFTSGARNLPSKPHSRGQTDPLLEFTYVRHSMRLLGDNLHLVNNRKRGFHEGS